MRTTSTPSRSRSLSRRGRCPPRSTTTVGYPKNWWRSSESLDCSAPVRLRKSAGWSCRPESPCGAQKRWRAAMPQPGWCVSIAITSSLLVAYLPASSREALFGDGRGVAAGVWAPRGTGRTVDGGVVVSGRWPFCSGISHADMMFAGCLVDDQRVPSVVALRKEDLAGSRHLAHAGPARHRQSRHRGR